MTVSQQVNGHEVAVASVVRGGTFAFFAVCRTCDVAVTAAASRATARQEVAAHVRATVTAGRGAS